MDWVGVQRAGLGVLRLPPDVFWDLTPAELRLMLGQEAGAAPLLSAGLAGLMRDWPDEAMQGQER